MSRAFNFNAGPAALPLEVLEIAQKELIDFNGTGMSIMEHSHRGKAYDAVHAEALANMAKLLGATDDYQILFLQGGASFNSRKSSTSSAPAKPPTTSTPAHGPAKPSRKPKR